MITYYQSRMRHLYPDMTREMFSLRAEAFWTRQNWDVQVSDGLEIDNLDLEADPLYVLSVCPKTTSVQGTFRLLPTTGPNLLKNSLAPLFDNPVDIASPFIWECSRFAVSQALARPPTPRGVDPVTVELMIAACSLSLEAGVSQLAAVFNPPMLRVYRRAGWAPEVLECSNTRVGLGIWDVSQDAIDRMQNLNHVALDITSVEDVVKAA